MFLPLYLGVLHAMEPDHVAVVTGASLHGDRRRAWKVGLAFGLSHMLAVAVLALASTVLGQAILGDGFFLWMDRLAWTLVMLLGLWNLSAAVGLRALGLHTHAHRHGPFLHAHPHPHRRGARRIPLRWRLPERPAHALMRRKAQTALRLFGPEPGHHAPGDATHTFHHSVAWAGAFFGLGGVRGFTTLMRQAGLQGRLQFLEALLLFGLGITAMFVLLSMLSGGLATRLGSQPGLRRALYALSGFGNLGVGLYLLFHS